MPDYFQETPEQTRIAREIREAEKALEGYTDITQASPAEIERAQAAVDAAIEAGMPEIYYAGIESYLRRHERKTAAPGF